MLATMYALAQLQLRDDRPVEDHAVRIYGVRWDDYVRFLELRGESAVPRLTYLKGMLEIMSPSPDHEKIKSFVGCLVEVYCVERDIEFTPYGSWTLKKKKADRGCEPDECYILGPQQKKKRPDLAIEVVWTSGRIDKLEIYRKLEVPEVWYWQKGRLTAHALRGHRYVRLERSKLIPGIDLDQLVTFLDRPSASAAMKAYRTALAR